MRRAAVINPDITGHSRAVCIGGDNLVLPRDARIPRQVAPDHFQNAVRAQSHEVVGAEPLRVVGIRLRAAVNQTQRRNKRAFGHGHCLLRKNQRRGERQRRSRHHLQTYARRRRFGLRKLRVFVGVVNSDINDRRAVITRAREVCHDKAAFQCQMRMRADNAENVRAAPRAIKRAEIARAANGAQCRHRGVFVRRNLQCRHRLCGESVVVARQSVGDEFRYRHRRRRGYVRRNIQRAQQEHRRRRPLTSGAVRAENPNARAGAARITRRIVAAREEHRPVALRRTSESERRRHLRRYPRLRPALNNARRQHRQRRLQNIPAQNNRGDVCRPYHRQLADEYRQSQTHRFRARVQVVGGYRRRHRALGVVVAAQNQNGVVDKTQTAAAERARVLRSQTAADAYLRHGDVGVCFLVAAGKLQRRYGQRRRVNKRHRHLRRDCLRVIQNRLVGDGQRHNQSGRIPRESVAGVT